jgi:hypothetical protein
MARKRSEQTRVASPDRLADSISAPTGGGNAFRVTDGGGASRRVHVDRRHDRALFDSWDAMS